MFCKDGKEVRKRSYVMGQSEISINRRRGRLSITVRHLKFRTFEGFKIIKKIIS